MCAIPGSMVTNMLLLQAPSPYDQLQGTGMPHYSPQPHESVLYPQQALPMAPQPGFQHQQQQAGPVKMAVSIK
jgi:hypothetical protein